MVNQKCQMTELIEELNNLSSKGILTVAHVSYNIFITTHVYISIFFSPPFLYLFSLSLFYLIKFRLTRTIHNK